MATTQEAAGNITRWADPQGDSFGVSADVSYSFWGGPFAFTADQQTAARNAMRLWSDVAQVNFFVDNADPEIGYKNYLDTEEPTALGWSTNGGPGNFNPDTTHHVGFNLLYNELDVSKPGGQAEQLDYGEMGLATLIHEVGHAIGFAHPDYPGHSQQYSTMSENYFFNNQWERTPLLHDIAAAQHFYGANMTTRTGDNVYGFNSNSGPQYALSSASEQAVFTIYDAGGNDTLNLSRYTQTQTINLNPNTFSNTGGLTANMSMADAVNVNGNNSWEAGFDPNRIANYIENAVGGSGRDIIYGNATGNTLRGENGNDEIWGGDGWDRLFGGAGVNDLHGGDGEDVLWGGSENDTLVGDAGNNSMFGGTGDDSYVVTDAGDTVTEDAGDANGTADKVYTTLNSYDMRNPAKGGNVEILQFVGEGNFVGRGNGLNNTLVGAGGADRLFGYAGNDILVGGEGQDTLDGGADNDLLIGEGGADTMYGGTGDDTYVVKAGDTVVESATRIVRDPATGLYMFVSGGNDTVETSQLKYTLDPNVENLTFTYRGLGKLPSIEAVGTGNNLDNVMRGSNGRDTLKGLEGDDTLDGGRNVDTMEGGAGDDTYYVDNASDVVDETYFVSGGGTGIARRNSGYKDHGDATDTVITTLDTYDLSKVGSNNFAARLVVPQTLYGTIENLTYGGTARFTGIGNDANNVITGGGLSDNLYGGLGHDTLRGAAGNDGIDLGAGDDKAFIDNGTAEGGDVVVGGGGFDTVYADDSTIAGGLRLNVFGAGTGYTPDVNRVAFTSAAIDVDFIEGNAGNDVIDASRLDQRIDISGMNGADTIIGGAAGDNLYGGGDADTITGGAGNDGIDLGKGWDTAYIDNGTAVGGDVVVGGERL